MRFIAGERLARLSLALLMSCGACAASAAEEPACSLDGILLGNDIDFNAAARRLAPAAGSMTIACKTVSHVDLTVEGAPLRIVRARLFRGGVDGDALDASLVTFERTGGGASRRLGWAVLQGAAADDETNLAPQARKVGDGSLVLVAPRHRHVFRIVGDNFERVAAFEWRDALAVDPALKKDGQPLGLDLETMEARIALVRDADSAPAGQSAYDSPKIAVARLDFIGGKLAPIQQSVVDRKPGESALVDEIAEQDLSARAAARNLPAGVEPCAMSGWSLDTDPRGLNVRAGPGASAKILGAVPPPLNFTEKDRSEFGVGVLRAEFRIVGYRAGWFLVEGISAPGAPYGAKYPAKAAQAFKGRGWVSSGMVGAAQGNMGAMQGRLYRAPHADALFDIATDANDKPYGAGSEVAHLRACSGGWGFVETRGGSRGWTRGMCSNQVTTCD